MTIPPTRLKTCAEPWGASAGRKKATVYNPTATLQKIVENIWHAAKNSSADFEVFLLRERREHEG